MTELLEFAEGQRVPSLLEGFGVEQGARTLEGINPVVLLLPGEDLVQLLMRSRLNRARMGPLLRTAARFGLAQGWGVSRVLEMAVAGWTAVDGVPREDYIRGVTAVESKPAAREEGQGAR